MGWGGGTVRIRGPYATPNPHSVLPGTLPQPTRPTPDGRARWRGAHGLRGAALPERPRLRAVAALAHRAPAARAVARAVVEGPFAGGVAAGLQPPPRAVRHRRRHQAE